MLKKPTLLEGFGFALLASLALSISLTALAGMLGDESLLRLLTSVFGFAYIVYLMGQSAERVGRIVVVTLWIGTASAAWWLSLPVPLYVLLHLGFVWLVRSLYHHGSLLAAIADLMLLGLGVVTAYWSFAHTGNAFLSVWCFLLLQALFVLIPSNTDPKRALPQSPSLDGECFERAHRNAETALRGIHLSL